MFQELSGKLETFSVSIWERSPSTSKRTRSFRARNALRLYIAEASLSISLRLISSFSHLAQFSKFRHSLLPRHLLLCIQNFHEPPCSEPDRWCGKLSFLAISGISGSLQKGFWSPMPLVFVLRNFHSTCSVGRRNSAASGTSSGNTWHGLLLGARIVVVSFVYHRSLEKTMSSSPTSMIFTTQAGDFARKPRSPLLLLFVWLPLPAL